MFMHTYASKNSIVSDSIFYLRDTLKQAHMQKNLLFLLFYITNF